MSRRQIKIAKAKPICYADSKHVFFIKDLSGTINLISTSNETFEKCLILFKFKKDKNFNHRNTCSISRIKI